MPELIARGQFSPVLVPAQPTWTADNSPLTAEHLVSLTDAQLARVDPLVVNLLVAKGILSLNKLALDRYQRPMPSSERHVGSVQLSQLDSRLPPVPCDDMFESLGASLKRSTS